MLVVGDFGKGGQFGDGQQAILRTGLMPGADMPLMKKWCAEMIAQVHQIASASAKAVDQRVLHMVPAGVPLIISPDRIPSLPLHHQNADMPSPEVRAINRIRRRFVADRNPLTWRHVPPAGEVNISIHRTIAANPVEKTVARQRVLIDPRQPFPARVTGRVVQGVGLAEWSEAIGDLRRNADEPQSPACPDRFRQRLFAAPVHQYNFIRLTESSERPFQSMAEAVQRTVAAVGVLLPRIITTRDEDGKFHIRSPAFGVNRTTPQIIFRTSAGRVDHASMMACKSARAPIAARWAPKATGTSSISAFRAGRRRSISRRSSRADMESRPLACSVSRSMVRRRRMGTRRIFMRKFHLPTRVMCGLNASYGASISGRIPGSRHFPST